jgi:hypothetical protein
MTKVKAAFEPQPHARKLSGKLAAQKFIAGKGKPPSFISLRVEEKESRYHFFQRFTAT